MAVGRASDEKRTFVVIMMVVMDGFVFIDAC
jgi:hypothetical protein